MNSKTTPSPSLYNPSGIIELENQYKALTHNLYDNIFDLCMIKTINFFSTNYAFDVVNIGINKKLVKGYVKSSTEKTERESLGEMIYDAWYWPGNAYHIEHLIKAPVTLQFINDPAEVAQNVAKILGPGAPAWLEAYNVKKLRYNLDFSIAQGAALIPPTPKI